MKKVIARVCISILMILMLPLSAYAQNGIYNNKSIVLDSQTQQVVSNSKYSKIRSTARGRLLSLAELQLSDEGDGVMGVYAETLCHVSVSEINMLICLDVWDDNIQDWITINNYVYTWKASDTPEGVLTDVSVSFLIEGLSKGRTYSLRGYHTAIGFDKLSEIMATETDGIVLK